MTVTPESDAAPWESPPPQPGLPTPSSPPPTPEPVRNGRGWLRWTVAAVASVLVLGLVAIVFVLANPPTQVGGVSALAKYVPDDAAAYAEARLDLPGDQRDRVISFMSHFPGFADPAAFDQKISDSLDELLRAEQDDLSWKGDIEPWFGGQVVIFGDDLGENAGTPRSGVIVLSVRDTAALERFLEAQVAGGDYNRSDYRGVTVWTGGLAGERTSLAPTDDALLIGLRVEDLHAALDVAAGERDGLADNPRFSAAMAKLGSDRLAALYLDGEMLYDSWSWGVFLEPEQAAAQQEQMPGTMVGYLRAEADHMLFEMRILPREGQSFPALPQSRVSTLPANFPGDVVGYAEVRDVGQGIKQYFEQIESLGGIDASEMLPPDVEQFLGVPLQDFLDFVGDTGVAVTADGGRYGGGLVAVVTDEDVARQRLDRLVTSVRTVLVFAGPDLPLTIDQETHDGVTVTVFNLADVGGMDLPFSSFSFALSDSRLYVGVDGFVVDALGRTDEDSLDGSASFGRALTAAGESNGGLFYMSMAELRRVIESEMPARDRAEAAELWPFFESFTSVIGTLSADGDEMVTRLVLFVE